MLKNSLRTAIAVAALISVTSVAQGGDFEGGQDHPELPRIDGTRIAGYAFAEYDAGRFVVAKSGPDTFLQPVVEYPEGKRTRIVYEGTETQTPLQIFRNYQRAFAGMGQFEEIFSCQRDICVSMDIGADIVWAQDNRIPGDFRVGDYDGYIYRSPRNHESPMYLYGTVTKEGKLYHVSMLAAKVTGAPVKALKNKPIIHVEILEVEDFEDDLVFVDADAMTSQLATEGHIALYGIQFDFDSASLQAASDATIAEIAKALNADADLAVYVVGHSDNEGAFDYNRSLSGKRAESVVTALVEQHGIDAGRLTPTGVGPVAPEASNDSEEGRALNRRVEIVKR